MRHLSQLNSINNSSVKLPQLASRDSKAPQMKKKQKSSNRYSLQNRSTPYSVVQKVRRSRNFDQRAGSISSYGELSIQ